MRVPFGNEGSLWSQPGDDRSNYFHHLPSPEPKGGRICSPPTLPAFSAREAIAWIHLSRGKRVPVGGPWQRKAVENALVGVLAMEEPQTNRRKTT